VLIASIPATKFIGWGWPLFWVFRRPEVTISKGRSRKPENREPLNAVCALREGHWGTVLKADTESNTESKPIVFVAFSFFARSP